MAGRLYVGTSGFAYPGWAPRFYPPGLPADRRLDVYASRLAACELNATWYRRPSTSAIEGWVRSTPETFRFAVKAQRGGSLRAMTSDPAGAVAWLTEPLQAFGERLGAVLFRVPDGMARDEGRLRAVLEVWPRNVPLAVELRDPSWQDDAIHAQLGEFGAALCASDLPDEAALPDLRLTGSFLYLRLRRHAYSPEEIRSWAARFVPFLEAGHDVFAFFRHDEDGEGPLRALALREAVDRELGRGAGT